MARGHIASWRRGIVSDVVQELRKTVTVIIMAWVNRPSGRYYYRTRRVGQQVVSEYVGTGYVAELLSDADELDRRRRQLEAAEWRAAVEDERRQDKALAQVDDLVKSAVAAVLIANGYHTHKRQWRKAQDER